MRTFTDIIYVTHHNEARGHFGHGLIDVTMRSRMPDLKLAITLYLGSAFDRRFLLIWPSCA